MKILTNRLSKILVLHDYILGENNFAALPEKSTIEPIHIINNVLEEAREQNKELWILLQDMSKAYDLVNRERLWDAMKCIKLPKKFINIIKNSLINRKNRVITDLGLTEEYPMLNGIDQGEIMSPLLWIIYYDPVFTKIKKEKDIGYTMDHHWNPNPASNKTISITHEIHNVAYMDDTTWLSKGKTEIEKQLDIANKFNRYNGIKVNPEKSQLIIVNSSEKDEDNYVKYGKNTTIIKPLKKGDLTQFLGVWISDKNNKNFVKKQIQKDVQTIYNLTRGKLVTAEQMAYVLNAVAISRIEYKAHLTIFNELEAKSLTAKLRTCLRNKIGIANTAPNVLLNRKELYNLIDFFDRQIEAQTSNLILKLNDKGALGITTEIRLRQLQTKEWLNDNPLHVWNYNNVNMFKGNTIAQILCLMGDLGLSIYFLHDNTFKIEGGSVSIIDILKDDYRKNINSLKKKNILYLEQLAYEGNKFFKEWMNISHHPDVYYKGKIPNW